MPTNQQALVEQIHTTATPLVLAITGGGSGAIAALLEMPGASATVLEAVVPYSSAALQQWLGGPVDHYCNERTARAMAMAAFERARQLSKTDPRTFRGIGTTASLVSTRPKRGPHRIHVAWQSSDTTSVVSCELPKGARTRAEEEHIATQLILNAVAESCGIESPLPIEHDGNVLSRREQRAPQAWTELLLGQRTHVNYAEQCYPANGPVGGVSDADEGAQSQHRIGLGEASHSPIGETPPILFPGAFNPIHAAHKRMAQIAAERLGQPVTFELSISNVDKPPLDFLEIADRLEQFSGERVLLTRAPRFVEKAQLAPGCTFIVGVDTIARIGDPKYYAGGPAEREAAIAAIAEAGCHFLVFGRSLNGKFHSLPDLDIPAALRHLCDEVPESVFREDISSTELRGA